MVAGNYTLRVYVGIIFLTMKFSDPYIKQAGFNVKYQSFSFFSWLNGFHWGLLQLFHTEISGAVSYKPILI